MKKLFTTLISCVAVAILMAPSALAQTPDGETPANEGVCDDLRYGFTPGLYGLCVGFCEAQDCEATLDATTGEVTFDESCRPSSPKLLANYNRRKQAADPAMPCVNIAAGECPCWTEQDIQQTPTLSTSICRDLPGVDTLWIQLGSGDKITQFIAVPEEFRPNAPFCQQLRTAFNGDPAVNIFLKITEAERLTCRDSIIAECTARGKTFP